MYVLMRILVMHNQTLQYFDNNNCNGKIHIITQTYVHMHYTLDSNFVHEIVEYTYSISTPSIHNNHYVSN